jgi:hypothetical protein
METQISGMKLDQEQKEIVSKYADNFCKTCEIALLSINIKEHLKAGGRTSYTTQLHAEFMHRGKKTMDRSVDVTDWDFHTSVKLAFKKLGKEIKNKEAKSWFERVFKMNRKRANS